MELVTHCDCFCDQWVNCKSILHRTKSFSKYWTKNISHPTKSVNNFLIISSETKNLTNTLVHCTVSSVSSCLVLNYKYCHVRRCDSTHRSYCVAVVARDEFDFSILKHLSSFFFCLCPLLEHYSTYARSLHRVWHILVIYRRTCMKNYFSIIFSKLWNYFFCTNVIF